MHSPSPRFVVLNRLAMMASMLALCLAAPSWAQEAAPQASQPVRDENISSTAHRTAHKSLAQPEEDIVVVGHPPTDYGLLAATASYSGDALLAQTRGQIGEMLNNLPGVSSTSFAPGASRPILRGFSGDRISVLTDGIGSLDVSNVSVDHAVVFDPLTVDHIDVFHGPSILLFGSNAIGGAVNAIDKRIPRSVPDRITVTAIGGYGTAAEERAMSGAIEIPLADRFVAHLDGSWRKTDDVRSGGYLYSPRLRSQMLHGAEHMREEGEIAEAERQVDTAQTKGRIDNTAARTSTIGAGLAFIDAGGSLGISYQRFDSRYGIPARPIFETGHHNDADDHEGEASHGHSHGEEPVSIDLVQNRFDLRGDIKLQGFLESVQVRGGYADYRHTEYEGDETGTVFQGKGLEARADFIQANQHGWRGRSGVQYVWRHQTAVGPEAIVPDYQIERFGLFTLQSLDLGSGFSLEGSGRYDRSRAYSRQRAFQSSWDLWSGAIGTSWKSQNGLGAGANFVHGERAPSPEELLSDGIHVATQSYEVGNRELRKERSNSAEAYVKYADPIFDVSLTGYISRLSDYIAPLATGDDHDGQPVYQYTSVDAVFKGFEMTGSVKAISWANGDLRLDAMADYTHAKMKNMGPVPRIAPLRLRAGSTLTWADMRLRGEVEWNAKQDRVGAYENPTSAFTLVNLSADWHPMGEEGPVTLMLAANNLFDVVGRRSTSFTQDFAPIAGRDVRITAKFTY